MKFLAYWVAVDALLCAVGESPAEECEVSAHWLNGDTPYGAFLGIFGDRDEGLMVEQLQPVRYVCSNSLVWDEKVETGQ